MNNNINFYCIGAQKAGTTTIHDILINHPDIFLPSDKEAHFFDFESRYSRGITWYLNEFFQSVGNEKIVGSITPEYMFFPKAAKRSSKSDQRKLNAPQRHLTEATGTRYMPTNSQSTTQADVMLC